MKSEETRLTKAIQIRVSPEMYREIQEVADRLYDGNKGVVLRLAFRYWRDAQGDSKEKR